MRLNKKHPGRLLSIWNECVVTAKELNTGIPLEFYFWQIDWDSHGIEENGICVCAVPYSDDPYGYRGKRSVIVNYKSMELSEKNTLQRKEIKSKSVLDNTPWLINWLENQEDYL